MYFIIKGEINFVLMHGKETTPYLSIPEGYYFGEWDLLISEDKIRHENTKASRKSELLTLSQESFSNVVTTFEEFGLELG